MKVERRDRSELAALTRQRQLAGQRPGPYTGQVAVTNGTARTPAARSTGAIDLSPRVVPVTLYAGDGAPIRLNVSSGGGDPVAIEGDVRAQVRQRRTDREYLVSFGVDLADAQDGVVALLLTGEQTHSLMVEGDVERIRMPDGELVDVFQGVWDVEWTAPGAQPLTLCQGPVTCYLDVTRAPAGGWPT